MPSFCSPVDIANRACQHMGVRQIDPIEGFNEDSVQAFEIGLNYDKLRLAELRRNTWRYSTRRCVLRPVGYTTMMLDAPLWSSSTTYFPGAVVCTTDGAIWTSNARDNLGNVPSVDNRWGGYFGPVTADEWSLDASSGAYFAGDIVYVLGANGVPVVYRSLVNNNQDTPTLAPTWVALAPDGTGQVYFKNQIVTYSSVQYQSLIDLNRNNTPGLAPAAWLVGSTYAAGTQVVGSDAVVYTSLSAGNTGHNPAGAANPAYWTQGGLSNPAAWNSGSTYAAGDQAVGSDGYIYASSVAGNIGNIPTSSPGYWVSTGAKSPWTTTITNSGGTVKWAKLDVGLRQLMITYPLGCGPYQESSSRNIYHLPSGYLRWVLQDPKAGQVSLMGAPTNTFPKDWTYESDYFTTMDSFPINFRFIADIRNVTEMDDMFCEGLAARIGYETCERVTGSSAKVQTCALAYKGAMTEARTVDAIEQGIIEEDLDDYLSCRY